MTRKQYVSNKSDLQLRKSTAEVLRDDIINNAKEQFYTVLNDIHDLIYNLEKELDFLEKNWRQRNWTAADFDSYDLVTSNVD